MEEEQENGISVKGEESSSKTPKLIIPEAAPNNRDLDVNGDDMDGNKTTGDLIRKASSNPLEAEATAVVAAKKSKSNTVGCISFIPYNSKTPKLIIPEAAPNNRELDVNADDMHGNKTTGDLQRKASSSPFEAKATAVVAAKKSKVNVVGRSRLPPRRGRGKFTIVPEAATKHQATNVAGGTTNEWIKIQTFNLKGNGGAGDSKKDNGAN